VTTRIQVAAEHVITAMFGRASTPAEIAQALADARLLVSDSRPSMIADWAELRTAQRELAEIRETHEAYVAEVEGALVELAALRRANPQLQERTAVAVAETARLRAVLRDIAEHCPAGYCSPPCPSTLARRALDMPAAIEGGAL
jgi:hypothetical protein